VVLLPQDGPLPQQWPVVDATHLQPGTVEQVVESIGQPVRLGVPTQRTSGPPSPAPSRLPPPSVPPASGASAAPPSRSPPEPVIPPVRAVPPNPVVPPEPVIPPVRAVPPLPPAAPPAAPPVSLAELPVEPPPVPEIPPVAAPPVADGASAAASGDEAVLLPQPWPATTSAQPTIITDQEARWSISAEYPAETASEQRGRSKSARRT
jgi:hypothetical protein